MEISEAVKKPFSDWSKFAIGSLLGLIPVVNFAVNGFGLQNVKESKKLPEFSFNSWVLGLKCVGVSVVYGLLTLLILLPFISGPIIYIAGQIASGNMPTASTFISVAGSAVFALLVTIATIPAQFGARLKLARTENFVDALNIPEVIKYSYRWSFIKHVLLAMLIDLPIAVVSGFVPIVGTAVGMYVMAVFTWTYVGANAPKK